MKSRVHGIRWYELEPRAIHQMCYNSQSKQLAVGRTDQVIEIWNFQKEALHLDRVIHLLSDDSVEALVWCKGRLFSAGLNGFLVEYDLINLKAKHSLPTSFGGCWCMLQSPDNSCLAVGTEDGYISIYTVFDEGIEYERSFEKQEERVICLNWHISGKYIVTGSVNSLSVWDAETGKTIQKIDARTENVETVILCIAVTSDVQVITGDSTGKIMFWDGLKGLLHQSVKSHQAEILCLLLNEEEGIQECTASGVDPQIVKYHKFSKKTHWVKGPIRRLHTHDVRCLLNVDDLLFSGGVDSYLIINKHSPNIGVRFSPILPTTYLHVATSVSCILLQYPSRVELWRLGNTDQVSDENYKSLSLSSNPLRLLNLSIKEKEIVFCSTLSCDAKWVAIATNITIKVFKIRLEKLNSEKPVVSVKKLKFPIVQCEGTVVLKFISDTNRLVSLRHSGELQVFDIGNKEVSLLFEFSASEGCSGSYLLALSDCGDYAAVGHHDGNITIFNLFNYTIFCHVPQCSSQVTAMQFVPNVPFLIIAYQNRSVFEFDVLGMTFCNSLGKLSLVKDTEWAKAIPDCSIRGITFLPEDKDSFILHDDLNVYYVNRTKLRDGEETEISDNKYPHGVKCCSVYEHLVHFVHLQADYMIAMQIPPLSLRKSLPSQLAQKVFGT